MKGHQRPGTHRAGAAPSPETDRLSVSDIGSDLQRKPAQPCMKTTRAALTRPSSSPNTTPTPPPQPSQPSPATKKLATRCACPPPSSSPPSTARPPSKPSPLSLAHKKLERRCAL